MTKPRLPRSEESHSRLGFLTIMDRGLAARYGVPYVRLAAFAIDLDRIQRQADEASHFPFGWEVFLTEHYLLSEFDPGSQEDAELIDDTVLGILDGDREALGGQLAFAVFDAIERGQWRGSRAFQTWKRKPKQLLKALARLFAAPDETIRDLAKATLEWPLEPPLAPTTRAWLEDRSSA